MASEREFEDDSGSGAVSSKSTSCIVSGDSVDGGASNDEAIESGNGGEIVDCGGDDESADSIPTAGAIQMKTSTQQPVLQSDSIDLEKSEPVTNDKVIDLDSGEVEKGKSSVATNPSNEQEKPQPKKEIGRKELAVATAVPYEGNELFYGGKKSDIKQVAIPTAEYGTDEEQKMSFYSRYPIFMWGCCALGIALIVLLTVLLLPKKTEVATPLPTEAPTISPTERTRESIIINTLGQKLSPNILVEGTFYSMALDWILNEDLLKIDILLDRFSDRLMQRFALAVFYFSTNRNEPWRSCNAPYPAENNSTCTYLQPRSSDDGFSLLYTEVPDQIRWLSGSDECDWLGVFCDEKKVVARIDVVGQGIRGNLERLLAGDAEEEGSGVVSNILLEAFPALQVLFLKYNELTGSLPASFAGFSDLIALDLHSNSLEGEIPTSFFDQLTSLQLLNLGNNQLSGGLDAGIGKLSELRGLQLHQNNFRGQLPSEIGKLSSLLTDSRFYENEFSGQLPTEIGLLSNLGVLECHNNNFTGRIPTEFGQLSSNMDILRLDGNQLSGSIPKEFCSLTNSRLLDLSSNALTGPLPTTELLQLQRLQQFKVSKNRLTGPIPSQLGSLPSLRLAWLHLNQFTGAVPNEVCEATSIPDTGLIFLQADCAPIDNPPNSCRCCTSCCDRSTDICLTSR